MTDQKFTLPDLQDAAAAGIISEETFQTLERFLVSSKSGDRTAEPEKFALFRGMNDLFLALGVFALSLGWFIGWGIVIPLGFSSWVFWGVPLIAIGMFGVLSEHTAGRLKTSLPAFLSMAALGVTTVVYVALISVATVTAGEVALELFMEPSFILGFEIPVLVAVITGFLFQLGFFWRYRLPISFALIALSVLGVLWAIAQVMFGYDFIQNNLTAVFALSGVILLALGVYVDTKDPNRRNGWAECSFWLYVLGAPATVHSVMALASDAAWVTLLLIAIAIVISLILDRRSLIVSSLIYIAIYVGEAFQAAQLEGAPAIAFACLTVGVVVLSLGFGWLTARRWVMKPFADVPGRQYLPPT